MWSAQRTNVDLACRGGVEVNLVEIKYVTRA